MGERILAAGRYLYGDDHGRSADYAAFRLPASHATGNNPAVIVAPPAAPVATTGAASHTA